METPAATVPFRFGVAGWSYPDWKGILYARGERAPLAFLARYVDLVEINSTFYRPPDARHAETWRRQVAHRPDFRFAAKLHQDFTHGGRLNPAAARAFREGLRPLEDAGMLTHLLAQFRYDVGDTPAHRDRLAGIRALFPGPVPLVFELRHRSWESPGAQAFLAALDVGVATLDYPGARSGFRLTSRLGRHRYFRLHGRRADAWFDPAAGRDATYDYLYNADELAEIAGRARNLQPGADSVTLVANNHFQAKQVTNILQLKALLTGARLPVPPGLLAAYPALASVAAPAESG